MNGNGAFHPKITASVLAGALTGMLISEANRRGITIDGAEGANITIIIAFVAGYFMPDTSTSSDGSASGAIPPIRPQAIGQQRFAPSPPPPPPPLPPPPQQGPVA